MRVQQRYNRGTLAEVFHAESTAVIAHGRNSAEFDRTTTLAFFDAIPRERQGGPRGKGQPER